MVVIILIGISAAFSRDADELDEQSYVLNIGIDSGTVERLRVTVQFPTIADGASGSASKGSESEEEAQPPGYVVAEAEGASFSDCLNMLHYSIPRRVTFLHARQIFVSESLASSDYFPTLLKDIYFLRTFRHKATFIVTQGNAGTMVKAQQPLFGTRISKSIEAALESYRQHGFVPNATLNTVYLDFVTADASALAVYAGIGDKEDLNLPGETEKHGTQDSDYYAGDLPRSGDFPTEYFGAVVFSQDKMTLALTGYEMQMLSMLIGDFQYGGFQVQGIQEGDVVQVLARQVKKPQIKVDIAGPAPVIDVEIMLEGGPHQEISWEEERVVALRISEMLQEQFAEMMERFTTLGLDPMHFGEYAKIFFLTEDDWRAYNWMERMHDAQIHVAVKFVMRSQDVSTNYTR